MYHAYYCMYDHSLPSLRPLLDVNYLPLTDMRIARTFCFSNLGQALYLTSATEIQRITYSQETCDNLQVGYQSWNRLEHRDALELSVCVCRENNQIYVLINLSFSGDA